MITAKQARLISSKDNTIEQYLKELEEKIRIHAALGKNAFPLIGDCWYQISQGDFNSYPMAYESILKLRELGYKVLINDDRIVVSW